MNVNVLIFKQNVSKFMCRLSEFMHPLSAFMYRLSILTHLQMSIKRYSMLLMLSLPMSLPSLYAEEPASQLELQNGYVNHKYLRRVERVKEHWSKLIPNLATLQYAGDIGFVSLGLGWDYGKHNRCETHILMGYLPKYHSDASDLTFTLKENLLPWNVHINDAITFQPVCFSFFLNTIFDDEFWVEQPDRYPKGYYGFSSKVRLAFGLGQRFTFEIPEKHRIHAERLSVYYELSTCDLYVVSAIPNKNIALKDILALGIGVQYRLF